MMLDWLSCANPHSLHELGREAMSMVDDCRVRCAHALGAEDPSQIIFTSGATEGNNWLAHVYKDDLAISPFEHSSMREPALHYGAETLGNVGYYLNEPERALLQSVMRVNNETGAILSAADGVPLHSDLTQAIGKVHFDLAKLSYATLSAHKFGGPKGVGILYAQDPYTLQPYLFGGEHELGLRAGTLNVAGIAAMTTALEIALVMQEENRRCFWKRNEIVLEALQIEPSNNTAFSPAILSLSFPGVLGESLVVELDALGFGISSGAACSSHSTEPSHVLTALGVHDDQIRGTIRVSFGLSNTDESTRSLAQALRSLTKGFGLALCH